MLQRVIDIIVNCVPYPKFVEVANILLWLVVTPCLAGPQPSAMPVVKRTTTGSSNSHSRVQNCWSSEAAKVGGPGGTGHPWDFDISETGDTLSPNPVTHLSLSEDTQPQK